MSSTSHQLRRRGDIGEVADGGESWRRRPGANLLVEAQGDDRSPGDGERPVIRTSLRGRQLYQGVPLYNSIRESLYTTLNSKSVSGETWPVQLPGPGVWAKLSKITPWRPWTDSGICGELSFSRLLLRQRDVGC
ncbi:PREDICTED: uncharacterized protein LOC106741340 isoform X1 [Dinoponera quadriceps]|uniref:Uncharacterized protein LOC106741340 isoform X1 n=1 Tax=Dinoponera quadriceps TaxID=609295 RepID=A0A6P3WRG8_DINQU|nr:PREDICTED: uncharacterized protein LOC106741340 isoform X1 [Dinoponera quadriceps]